MKRWLVLLALAAGALAGCEDSPDDSGVPPRDVSTRPAEVPAMDLARALRVHNWTATGSCTWASTASHFEWLGSHEWAMWIRANESGAAGVEDVGRVLDGAGVDYVVTKTGDVSLLEQATETRRGAVIYFYDNHCINFVGHHVTAEGDFAYLLDNNHTDSFIKVPWAEFVPQWRHYGGTALVVVATPPPPVMSL